MVFWYNTCPAFIYYAYIANMPFHFPGIHDLDDVLTCVENFGLVNRWERIGLRLRVTYPELQTIRKEETGQNERLAAMLHKWLRSGSATKEVLAAALKHANKL